MGTNISQGIGVCNTSKRGTLLFFRNFIFIFFFWLNGALYVSLFLRTASAKNLKASSNKQMTKDKGRESVNNAQRYSSLFFSYLQNFSLVPESFNAVNWIHNLLCGFSYTLKNVNQWIVFSFLFLICCQDCETLLCTDKVCEFAEYSLVYLLSTNN